MCETDKVIKTRPVRQDERFMQERFSEAIADQSKLISTLAQQLLIVELIIPGLYASILKLVNGNDQVVLSWPLGLAFICWLAAVIFTITAIIPQHYKAVQRNSPDSIEAFFDQSARYKKSWLLASATAFAMGIFFTIMDLFL